MKRFLFLLLFASVAVHAADIQIKKADKSVAFVTPSSGITAISDAGVITLGSISLTTGVAGTLPVANGGTGISSGTSGGILAYTGTGTLASSGLLAANALLVGGGAGAAPSSITTGTGVVTALGNAINTSGGIITPSNSTSSGAVLVGGGASGTAAAWTLTTGTGTPVFNNTPTLITPVLGVATGTSLALDGSGAASTSALKLSGVPFAGTGTTSFPLVYINDANATASSTLNTAGTYLGVNGDGSQDPLNLLKDGTSVFKVGSGGLVTFTGGNTVQSNFGGAGMLFTVDGSAFAYMRNTAGRGFEILHGTNIGWSSGPGSNGSDLQIGRDAAATVQLGLDAAGVTDQAIKGPDRITSDGVGGNLTIAGGRNRGASAGGSVILQTSPPASATTTGTLETGLTVASPTASMKPNVVIGSAAVATNASDGFLYIPTCAGTPTGTPTTYTGRVALVYDTTNHQFWIYDGGAWLQPKTPAAAAIVTWQ